VEAPPNKPPEVGVDAAFEDVAPPPNRPPAGFCASPAGFWPNIEAALFAGAALLPPLVPPNENDPPGAAFPKRLPEAGAVVVVFPVAALDEPWVPKGNGDAMMFSVSRGRIVS
jgi:hypothetical protein